eukprot:9579449-Heterocapsa_arctica.AAC.1
MLDNLDLLWAARYRLASPVVLSPSLFVDKEAMRVYALERGSGSLAQRGPGPGSLPSHSPSGDAGRSEHPLERISSVVARDCPVPSQPGKTLGFIRPVGSNGRQPSTIGSRSYATNMLADS